MIFLLIVGDSFGRFFPFFAKFADGFAGVLFDGGFLGRGEASMEFVEKFFKAGHTSELELVVGSEVVFDFVAWLEVHFFTNLFGESDLAVGAECESGVAHFF